MATRRAKAPVLVVRRKRGPPVDLNDLVELTKLAARVRVRIDTANELLSRLCAHVNETCLMAASMGGELSKVIEKAQAAAAPSPEGLAEHRAMGGKVVLARVPQRKKPTRRKAQRSTIGK